MSIYFGDTSVTYHCGILTPVFDYCSLGVFCLKSVFYKILRFRSEPLVAECFSHIIFNSGLEYSSLFHFLIFRKLFAVFV